jgi:hypothetical protein
MAVSQLATSLAYVDVPIKSRTADGYYYDPTHDAVVMAFIDTTTTADPQASDFVTAQWSGTPGLKGQVLASCLVGPGGAFTGVKGKVYNIYVKISDTPEVPILQSDTLTIT